MIRVRVDERFQLDAVAVEVFEPGETTARIHRHVEGDQWAIEEVAANAWPELVVPSFTIPREFVIPLLAALSNFDPPDRAQAKHLDDAMYVRDRLLDLVADGHPLNSQRRLREERQAR